MVKNILITFVFGVIVASASAQANFSYDINRMSSEVQQKINSNKQLGVPLFTGIGKSYSIEVKNVNSAADVSRYAFLKENRQVLQIEFLEKNKIEVTVTNEYPSEQLKGIFLQEKVVVNFLDEYFKLMNFK